MFDPSDANEFPFQSVNTDHQTGNKHGTINLNSFGNKRRIQNYDFIECDFFGGFDPHTIVFKKCNFSKCDFGLSYWKNTKFTECNFKSSSFTQSTFEDCEFRDCRWEKIGLSGNETKFRNSTITNPRAFIEAAYTNLDQSVLCRHNTTAQYQRQRLERTKASVSRVLLNILSYAGEEKAYYDAVNIHCIQSFNAEFFEAVYQAEQNRGAKKLWGWSKALIFYAERRLIQAVGLMNKWGASLVRPILVGLAILGIFTIIYRITGLKHSWAEALIASLDITIVAGYTKQAVSNQPLAEQSIFLINALFGVAWYAVIVPTLINRVSRVR